MFAKRLITILFTIFFNISETSQFNNVLKCFTYQKTLEITNALI